MGSLIWVGKEPVTVKGGTLVLFHITQCKLLHLSLGATRTEGMVLTHWKKKRNQKPVEEL